MANNSLFNDTKTAFQLKSDSELERAYFLFKMIANEPLVKIGTAVTKFALNVHLPVEGLIRSTVFDHFCGGVTEEDCLPIVDKMFEIGKVHSVLDYSVEGAEEEIQFDSTLNKVIQLTRFAQHKEAMPFAVFKPTGLGKFAIWQKMTKKKELTPAEKEEWNKIVNRFDLVCKAASETHTTLLIDAEESWMQDAADHLCEQMMKKYNKERTVVCNTLQCYRWDRLDYLKRAHETALKEGYKLGFKIVRGAYMEKENERADEKKYPSPICKNKKETDENFDRIMEYIFNHLDAISLFLGTHNEASTYKALTIMKEKKINANSKKVWFGQLFGMSDHISYNLAKEGYNVVKYIPFGPVKDVMPYLIRRAEENTSVAGQTSRELSLLKTEKKRRKI